MDKFVKILVVVLLAVTIGLSSCKKAVDLAPNVKIWVRGDTAVDVRNGVRLELYFDENSSEFKGTVVNNNRTVATNARVEVHTFDSSSNVMFEYGPSTPTDLQAGEILDIALPAANAGNFTTFTMHAEIGTTAGTGG